MINSGKYLGITNNESSETEIKKREKSFKLLTRQINSILYSTTEKEINGYGNAIFDMVL